MNENEKQFWSVVFLRAIDHAHGAGVAAVHAAKQDASPGLDVAAAANAADEALKRYRQIGEGK